jgi:hypothetical protein
MDHCKNKKVEDGRYPLRKLTKFTTPKTRK